MINTVWNKVPKGFKDYAPGPGLIGNCIGFRVTTGGTVTFTDGKGVSTTVTLADKETFTCQVTKITAATAVGIQIFLEA